MTRVYVVIVIPPTRVIANEVKQSLEGVRGWLVIPAFAGMTGVHG
jgi:hypothetical protein